MAKLRTLAEKQDIRYRMVYMAFSALITIPLLALGLLAIGISPAPAAGIFSTAAATLGAVIIGFFATSPKDDSHEGFKGMSS